MKNLTKKVFVLFFGLLFVSGIVFSLSHAKISFAESENPVVVDAAQTTSVTEEVSVPTPTEELVSGEIIKPESEVAPPPVVGDETVVAPELVKETVPVATPQLSTDKGDYHPGETVSIFGKFFQSLQNIVLKIFGSDENDQNYTESTQNITTDENGSFLSKFSLDNLYRPFYEMTASTLGGTLLASGWFRDAAVSVYDQCANDSDNNNVGGDTLCNWVNGNLNGNNSTYQEGDSTVQRLALDGFAPNSSHTVTIQYGTTKQGKHAYDFLTTWNHSENFISEADRCGGITGCTSETDTSYLIPNDTNGSGEFEGTVGLRNFVMRGGSITSATAPSLSGSYTGDSETSITITFTVDGSGSMCSTKGQVTSCGIALWFGAHIAKTADWQVFNNTVGAGSISGSPYHVAITSLDGGSIGNRDNQMQSEAIIPFVPEADATIHVNKIIVGSLALPTSFSVVRNNEAPVSFDLTGAVNYYNVPSGTYNIVETSAPGYATTYSSDYNLNNSCSNLVIPLGSTLTYNCTITNTVIQPKLTVTKVVVNDNGGTKTVTDFPLFVNSTSVTSGVQNGFNVGSYTVSETSQSGYVGTITGDCAADGTITLAPGDVKNCTITNNDIAPELTLVKQVINDNGGTAKPADWILTAAGYNTQSPDAGTYNLSESNGPTGYTQTSLTCSNSTGQVTSVTLGLGEKVTCTFVNDDVAPKLHLRKVVINDNGGTATSADFTITADGATTNDLSGISPVDSDTSLKADTFALSESSLAGYAASAWNCVGGTQNGSNITVGVGEEATCTITNDDQAAHLIVIKHVVNDNGGDKVSADFSTTITGVTTTTPTAAGAEAPGVNNTLTSVGSYGVDEGIHVGYDKTLSADCSGTIALGETKTCTITNDDIAPTLKLVKTVVNNNGGLLTQADFPSFVDGIAQAWDATAQVLANTKHIASETSHAGYAPSVWGGDCAADGSITLLPGDNKTCTITNDDVAPKLTLVKTVLNDNGGTKVVSDFPLFINGVAAISSTSYTQVANSLLTATETNLTGYAPSVWGGDCAADGSITLLPGDDKTCTITNDDIAPKLTVIKTVVNDNGGTKVVSDFPLFINGNGVTSGIQNTLSSNVLYTATETGDTGYVASDWGGDCAANGTITLAPGDEKTCTITNNDIAPKLHLRKVVINDNGGTATVANFTLTADGTTTNDLSGISSVDSGATLKADTFALSESNIAGYIASAWVCVGGTQNGSNITVGIGGEATCTITNNDIAPKLTLVKEVTNDNGGNAVATDWMLSATGPTSISGAGGTVSDSTFKAGNYILSESTGPNGYKASTWSCVGGTQNGSNVSLGLGQEVTCTITNDDQQAYIKLVKVVTNDNGGSAKPDDFKLTLEGGAVLSEALTPVNPGTYTAAETLLLGYTFSGFSGDCDINGDTTVALGENKTCTLTNNDIQPKLIVIKHVINDDGDIAKAEDFQMHLTGLQLSKNDFAGSEIGVEVGLNAGAYTADETTDAGYVKTLSADCSGTIAVGETKTCTITNNDKPHATRTQGFWQTHTVYTESIFDKINPKMVIGNKTISSYQELFAGFYANIAKTSLGKKRSAVDQARMQMLQQWLAAKLNCQAFGCSVNTQTLLTNSASAWAGTNSSLILSYASQLDVYNNSNDALMISGQGKATPKNSQSIAGSSLSFWNVLP